MVTEHVRLLKQAVQLSQGLNGIYYECGVYKGGSAYVIKEAMAKNGINATLRLFDTFCGIPIEKCDFKIDKFSEFGIPRFHDTSLAQVKLYLKDFKNITYHVGLLPDSFNTIEKEDLAFVHIDLDLYQSYRDVLAYTYPLMVKGGVYFLDDYRQDSCPGATKAVDEFLLSHNIKQVEQNILIKL